MAPTVVLSHPDQQAEGLTLDYEFISTHPNAGPVSLAGRKLPLNLQLEQKLPVIPP